MPVSERHLAGTPPKSLVSFLLERLAEDEAGAQDALRNRPGGQQASPDGSDRHLVRQSPARVLRDVAAKRAIVQMWLTGLRARLVEHRTDGLDLVDAAIVELAAVYADHPDFHPSWSPARQTGQGRADARWAGNASVAGDPAPLNVVDLRSGRSGHRPV